jgi:hypothetical protein
MVVPGSPRMVVLVALAALVIPSSDVSATRSQRPLTPTRSVAYLASPQASAPGSTGRLAATRPAAPRWVLTRTDRRTGWVELSSTPTNAASTGAEAAPDGHGYVGAGDFLAGQTVAAGVWSSTVTLKARGTLLITPRVRAYRLDRHGYHLLASATGRAVRLGKKRTRMTLPPVSLPAVSFRAGDRLYLDLGVKVTGAGSASGDGVLHQDNVGAAAALTFPHRVKSPTIGAKVWQPRPGVSWQWQISGKVDPSLPVQMYDIDLFDAQPAASAYRVPGFGTVHVPRGLNAGVISDLHRRGKIVVCYLDTGAYESYRPDAGLFPDVVIGASTGWAGESWLDIRTGSWHYFEPLIVARLDLAKRSGCDGVEPDQNNPWGNSPGFPIALTDQKSWYLEVARLAHDRGLSVGQKNGIETTDAVTIAAFDWNLNEECNKYSECAVLSGYIAAGKAVFQVEYQDESMTTSFCRADNAARFDGLLKRLELGSWRVACQPPRR